MPVIALIVVVGGGLALVGLMGASPWLPVSGPTGNPPGQTTTAAAAVHNPTPTSSTPSSPSDRLLEANTTLERGDLGRGIELLSSLRAEHGPNPAVDEALYRAYLAHGQALLSARELDLSYALFGEALKLRTNDPEALDGQKHVVLTKNADIVQANWTANPEAAIVALEESMRFDPDYGQTREWLYALLVGKADRLSQAGEKQGAVVPLMRAVEVDPDRPEARQRLTQLTPTPLPTATRPPATATPTRVPATVTPTRVPVSLANGAFLTSPRYPRGLGSLSIRNGTTDDAVAKLKDQSGQRTLAAIYVRAGGEVTLTNIGVGTYALQFMTGRDWSAERSRFLDRQSASQFRDLLVYQEIRTVSGTQYSMQEVSLHAVPGGTARTDQIDPESFARD